MSGNVACMRSERKIRQNYGFYQIEQMRVEFRRNSTALIAYTHCCPTFFLLSNCASTACTFFFFHGLLQKGQRLLRLLRICRLVCVKSIFLRFKLGSAENASAVTFCLVFSFFFRHEKTSC